VKRLVLIDGYGFLFKAFFACKDVTGRNGMSIGALYGFMNMVARIIKQFKHSHIAVAFDTGKKTFRSTLYQDYKANRPPCPPELIPQFPLVRKAVEALNITSLEKDGYEADDVIATCVKNAEKAGFDVIIASSDKDLMQLVTDKVLMFDGKDTVGIEEVRDRWGVFPHQLLDVLSLIGDRADNVPGVAGIGKKIAADLVSEYKSLENLYNSLDSIKQDRKRKMLIDGKDAAFLSKRLIALTDNIKLDYTMDDLSAKDFDSKVLSDFLCEQGLDSLLEKLILFGHS